MSEETTEGVQADRTIETLNERLKRAETVVEELKRLRQAADDAVRRAEDDVENITKDRDAYVERMMSEVKELRAKNAALCKDNKVLSNDNQELQDRIGPLQTDLFEAIELLSEVDQHRVQENQEGLIQLELENRIHDYVGRVTEGSMKVEPEAVRVFKSNKGSPHVIVHRVLWGQVMNGHEALKTIREALKEFDSHILVDTAPVFIRTVRDALDKVR